MNYLCCDSTETNYCSPIRQRASLAGHAPTCTRRLNGTLNVLTPPGTSRRVARRRSVPTVDSAPPSDNGTTVSVAMDVCIFMIRDMLSSHNSGQELFVITMRKRVSRGEVIDTWA